MGRAGAHRGVALGPVKSWSRCNIWIAECKVTNGDEAALIDAVGNATFGKAFEVLNQHFSK